MHCQGLRLHSESNRLLARGGRSPPGRWQPGSLGGCRRAQVTVTIIMLVVVTSSSSCTRADAAWIVTGEAQAHRARVPSDVLKLAITGTARCRTTGRFATGAEGG